MNNEELRNRLGDLEDKTGEILKDGQTRAERIVRLEERVVSVHESLASHVAWEERRYEEESKRQKIRDKDFLDIVKSIRSKMWFVVWGLLASAISVIGYFADSGVPWVEKDTFNRFIEAYETNHPKTAVHNIPPSQLNP